MDLLDQLANNKGTVSSALGKELAERVLKGDKSILEQATGYVSYDLDNQKSKGIRAGAAKILEKVAEKQPDLIANKLDKLKLVLDTALKQNIKVVITLFDFYGNYDVLDWTLNQRHAERIVETFKDHEAILAWDIKNEPNLDFESRGKENVIAWLDFMLILIKEIF